MPLSVASNQDNSFLHINTDNEFLTLISQLRNAYNLKLEDYSSCSHLVTMAPQEAMESKDVLQLFQPFLSRTFVGRWIYSLLFILIFF